MKKLLTFLTLLVLGLLLPNKASAWDFGAGTDPSSINLYLEDQNVSVPMTFSNGQWTAEFSSRSSATTERFKLNPDGGWYAYNLDVPLNQETDVWVNVDNKDEYYKFTGLTGGVKYKVTITARDAASCKMKIVAVETLPDILYLYLSTGGYNTVTASASNSDGVYEFTEVSLTAGQYFVLSSKSSNTGGYEGLKGGLYTANGDANVPTTNGVTCGLYETGAYKVEESGKYKITVNLNDNKLYATVTETVTPVVPTYVHMPLSPKDFEGGKKHYFIVGNRMGEWRLLPEWELKADSNGDMVLNNRWFYPGIQISETDNYHGFAIGVVDNYADYIKHKYTYYCKRWAFKEDALECTGLNNGVVFTAEDVNTVASPDSYNNFWVAFSKDLGGGEWLDNGKQAPYWNAVGTLIKEVRVSLDESGKPTSIKLSIGSKEEANKHRFFTIVGDEIYNKNFCNSNGPGKTLLKAKGQTNDNGWQEGWIQYDTITHAPFIDGYGHYLYHTSYTPDYFNSNPSLFNKQLDEDTEFSYTSSEAQFVHYSNLTDTISDPYLGFYHAFDKANSVVAEQTYKGTGYNFKVKTINGGVENLNDSKLQCYVIRDMWIGGLFKVWTGWGGNDRRSGTSDKNGATWHGENGGPMDDNLQVVGFDINKGIEVNLYNNEKNKDGVDYKVSDGDPEFFNRVILWYNIDRGIGDSFIQLIQETSGPAIFATVHDNQYTEKKNAIKYNWYLNQSDDDERQVLGFYVTRYLCTSSGNYKQAYTQGNPDEFYDISKLNIKAKNLTKTGAVAYAEQFTSFIDYGDDNQGHAPGLYQYTIVVKFDDGELGEAVSNKVAIYDNSMINLQANPYQLVRLDAEGKTALGLTGDSSQGYMIYDPNENPQYFVLDVDANGVPSNGSYIDSAKANDFLLNNQDKYEWTSQFYVQCLDKDYYEKTFSEYIATKYVLDEAIPTPVVSVAEGENSVGAVEFKLGEKTYYSAILNRGGDLSNGSAKVTLNYKYKDATDGLEKDGTTTVSTGLNPVAPRPYNAEYYFTLETSTQTVSADYAKLERTPVSAMGTNAPFKIVKSEDDIYSSYLYTANGGGKLNTHVMVLNVEYNSPNVDADILKKYEVGQTVAVEDTNNTTLAQSDRTVNYVDATDKAKLQYLTFKGMAPFNDVIPVVKYSNTVYQVREGYTGKEGEKVADVKASFGQDIQFNALHTFESGNNSLSNLHYGNILRDGNTMDIMYKGHENFVDSNPVLHSGNASIEGDNAKENVEAPSMSFNYYVVELGNTNSNDYSVYDYIWSHPACKHREGDVTVDPTTGFILNDTDPMIGAYVAKGFTASELQNITTYFAQIFLFSNTNVNSFNGIRIVDEVEAEAEATVMALPTIGEMADGNVGGMPDDGTVPESVATYDSSTRWVMLGSYIKSKTNVSTGVEDVLAGENGEAVYYNLQGIRVDNPSAAGVYIRVQGKQIDKVVVK